MIDRSVVSVASKNRGPREVYKEFLVYLHPSKVTPVMPLGTTAEQSSTGTSHPRQFADRFLAVLSTEKIPLKTGASHTYPNTEHNPS